MTLKLPLRSILLAGVLLALGALLVVGLPGPASAQNNITGTKSATLIHNFNSWGIWMNSDTIWVSDSSTWRHPGSTSRYPIIAAYPRSFLNTGKGWSGHTFKFVDGTTDAAGIWSDGATMWMVDHRSDKVYAYNLSTRARDGAKDITLNRAHRNPNGLWGNLDTRIMYVADWEDDILYAYNMDSGAYLSGENISIGSSGNNNPEGIWSDGRTMWVVDLKDKKMYAYNLRTKARDTSREFNLHSENVHPRGVFSDGSTMWVVNDKDPDDELDVEYIFSYDVSSITSYDDLRLVGSGPSGIWSDGTTTYVSDWYSDKIYAYTNGRRLHAEDFDTLAAAGNTSPHGIWSDGTTVWVADWDDAKLYAYNAATKARDSDKDIALHADNAAPVDIWSDGTIMYVADHDDKKIYAYDFDEERRSDRDISLYSGLGMWGIWSDGTTMWVTDNASDTLYAYDFEGERRSSRDIDLAAANGTPRGIWSDGTTMRVLEHQSATVHDYSLSYGPPTELPHWHSQTSGIWSDGSTTWVSNWGYEAVYAYNTGTGTLASDKEITALRAAGNETAHGIWSNSTASYSKTMWVADWDDAKLYAYDMGTRARDPDRDIALHADNAKPMDIWSDGATMYVADAEDGKIYAYTLTGAHSSSLYTLDGGHRQPDQDVDVRTDFGIWSNGSVMWAVDAAGGKLLAYSMAGERRPDQDIFLDSANDSPRSIWSDGTSMYVLQHNTAKIFNYRMPLGITLSYPLPYGTQFGEELGARRSKLTATLTGGRVAPSDITLSVTLSHITTDDDDFEEIILGDITIAAGQRSGGARHDFYITDDADNEGVETLAITASGVWPGTGESLTARATLALRDNDPDPTSVPNLAAGPAAGYATRLQVSWGSVPAAEEYRVEHKTGGGSYGTVARADATATSETLTGLTADTTYTVRVTAVDTDGGGSVDLVHSETTGTTLDAMGDVTVSAVTDNHDKLDVSWPAVNGATGYRVEWKAPGGSYDTVTRGDATATTERITGLTAKTSYAVRVTALHTIDGQTAGGDSAEGSGTTGSDRTVSATDAAGALKVEQLFSSGIDLLWDAVATVDDNAVTGYTIEWTSSADGPWVALDYPGEGQVCIANMTIDYLTNDGTLNATCYFRYSDASDKITGGSTYYYRLVAHAGDVDSQPGPVLSRKVDVGGL